MGWCEEAIAGPGVRGANAATGSLSSLPGDFVCPSISAVAILCLDPKPDGVREKIEDSIWLLCLAFFFPPQPTSP